MSDVSPQLRPNSSTTAIRSCEPVARAEVVDELHAARDGGREADAVVGAVDVVVHRLRDGDDRDALLVHPQGEGQRVVAADRDERRRCPSDSSTRSAWSVRSSGPSPLAPVGEVRRDVARPDAARVHARGVQERAAGAVDGPDGRRRERLEPLGRGCRVVGVVMDKRRPAAAQADDLVPVVARRG